MNSPSSTAEYLKRPMTGETDLYIYARAYISEERPRRYSLFAIPSFVAAFRAMSVADQRAQWEKLSVTRSGAATQLTPPVTLDQWFHDLCRLPSAFDFTARCWTLGACCPEVWLRERMAERLEAVKVTQLPPTREYLNGENKRKRTAWQGVLAPGWLKAMTQKIIGEMDAMEYQAWLGGPSDPARYPLVMVHDKAAQRGEIDGIERKHFVSHPAGVPDTPKRKGASVNPGRNAQLAAATTDRSARIQAQIEADFAMLNLGGTMKDLRDAMASRIGHRPSLGAVAGYIVHILGRKGRPYVPDQFIKDVNEVCKTVADLGEKKLWEMKVEAALLGANLQGNANWNQKLRDRLENNLPRT